MRPSLMVKMVRKNHTKTNLAHFDQMRSRYLPASEIKNLFYLPDQSEYHSMDIYGPMDSEEILPVILMIHGGGYICGDKFINEAQSRILANGNFRVINVNYSLQPEVSFIDVVKELFAALHWCEENASKYHFSSKEMFVCGDSAGGHYALLLAAVQNSEYLQEYFGITPLKYGIRGIVAGCPMTEIRSAKEKSDMTNRFLRKNTLHSGRVNDDTYIDNVSIPFLLNHCNFPDVFILTTPTDSLLYEETKRLHKTLEKEGITHQYKEYISEKNPLEHVFHVVEPEFEESVEANNDILKYFRSKL